MYAKPVEGMDFINEQVRKPVHIFDVKGLSFPLELHHPL